MYKKIFDKIIQFYIKNCRNSNDFYLLTTLKKNNYCFRNKRLLNNQIDKIDKNYFLQIVILINFCYSFKRCGHYVSRIMLEIIVVCQMILLKLLSAKDYFNYFEFLQFPEYPQTYG